MVQRKATDYRNLSNKVGIFSTNRCEERLLCRGKVTVYIGCIYIIGFWAREVEGMSKWKRVSFS
jgi:hypothetical protein